MQPWIENPFSLISWLSMHQFAAHITSRIMTTMTQLVNLAEDHGMKSVQIKETLDMQEVRETADDLKKIGCPVSSASFLRLADDGEDPILGIELAARIKEMHYNLDKELSQNLFFWVPVRRARWYSMEAEDMLGAQCFLRFSKSGIQTEMIHAARCYTFGQFTACAFHLMRITEDGVYALAKAIGHPIDQTKNWGKFFKQFDQLSAVDSRQRTGCWKKHSLFLDEAGGNMRAVKNAWRNATMHLEKSYDEDQAELLMRNIPAFMKHLASRVNETGKFCR